MIKDCIISQTGYKSRKSTWIKESKRWLKINKTDIDKPQNEVLQILEKYITNKLHERDKSVIGEWAKKVGITDGYAIRKAEISKRANYIGVNLLTKIRTGTMQFTNNLVKQGIIPERLKNKCLCCKENILDNVEHMMLYCSAFDSERRTSFSGIENKLQNCDENKKIKILKKLLGEEGLTSDRKVKKRVLNSIKYLTLILPKRSAFIAELKGELQGVTSP